MIKRDLYLQRLISRMHNGMIKVITGIRRCGKSYLLFNIFYEYLLSIGVSDDHIIKISLDDRFYMEFRDPDYLCKYVHDFIKDDKMYYVLLDEVQYVDDFEDVLNSFLHIKNVDCYVTGSNAKFLSKDIITEFRGRGDQVHISPLSFSEFANHLGGDINKAFNEYLYYGGMPHILEISNDVDKISYLKDLFLETYLKDIVNRNNVKNVSALEDLFKIISSGVGSLVSYNKLSNAFKSKKNVSISPNTIKEYLDYGCDAFIISRVDRYDIKGKNYIEALQKYYFSDIGIRNAMLNFRQVEENHLMENIIYNEMIYRGYNVDVGNVIVNEKNQNNNYVRKNLEVDFICSLGDKKFYIQSALNVDSEEKLNQEAKSLRHIDDSFKKIIIVKDDIIKRQNEDGILLIGIKEFLLNPDAYLI